MRRILIEFLLDDDSPLTAEKLTDAMDAELGPACEDITSTTVLHEDPLSVVGQAQVDRQKAWFEARR